MAVKSLNEIKTETGRDLTGQTDGNTLIPAETSNGTFGVAPLSEIKTALDLVDETEIENKADKSYVTTNVFLSPIELPLNEMYTFQKDGYVYLSCSSTSGLSISCNIYGSNDNSYQIYTQSYMAFPIYVKKGMRIKITSKKTGTVTRFFPLS